LSYDKNTPSVFWENGVSQLVSEQVGSSGQVVESFVSCDSWILSLYFSN